MDRPLRFGDIEYSATGDAATMADAVLVEQLAPRGRPVDQAIVALPHAGAHQLRAAADGDLRFIYATSDFANDMQRDTRVVIRVALNGSEVGSVSIEREAYSG